MTRLTRFYLDNSIFFNYFFLWYFLLSILIFFFPKEEAFLLFNSAHHPFLDYFFTVVTLFGDGLFVVLVGLVYFFFRSRKLGIAVVATYIGSGLICSLLKRSFQTYRPGFSLQDHPDFHSVPWLPLAQHNAFPSGHSTSAFALAAALALFGKDIRLALIALLLACLTGYSRVYLGQHYWDDVWFGTMLGMGFSCCYYLVFTYFRENSVSVRTFSPPSFRI